MQYRRPTLLHSMYVTLVLYRVELRKKKANTKTRKLSTWSAEQSLPQLGKDVRPRYGCEAFVYSLYAKDKKAGRKVIDCSSVREGRENRACGHVLPASKYRTGFSLLQPYVPEALAQ